MAMKLSLAYVVCDRRTEMPASFACALLEDAPQAENMELWAVTAVVILSSEINNMPVLGVFV